MEALLDNSITVGIIMGHMGAFLRSDPSLWSLVNRGSIRKEGDPEWTEKVRRWNGIHEYRHKRVLNADNSSANEARFFPRESICPHSTSS